MSVSSVSTVTASSPISFQDATRRGFERAQKTLRGITKLEVVGERANIEKGKVKDYEVELKIVFSLE